MVDNDFKIGRVNGTIIIEKDTGRIAISQALDDDIWFSTSSEEVSLEISMRSRNYSEWQTYLVFEKLLKLLVGRFMLSGDYKSTFPILPKDFIDLENNVITWHSDSGTDNVLKFEYSEKLIKISISKSRDADDYVTNAVRIRTSGSNYEYYYQEFLTFFRELYNLEQRLNPPSENVKSIINESSGQRKRIFKRG